MKFIALMYLVEGLLISLLSQTRRHPDLLYPALPLCLLTLNYMAVTSAYIFAINERPSQQHTDLYDGSTNRIFPSGVLDTHCQSLRHYWLDAMVFYIYLTVDT